MPDADEGFLDPGEMLQRDRGQGAAAMRGDGSRCWNLGFLVVLAVVTIAVLAIGGLGFLASGDGARTGGRRILGAIHRGNLDPDAYIAASCHGTIYPEVCVSSIAADSRSRQGFSSPGEIIHLAIDLAARSSSRSYNLTAGILDRAGGNKNLTAASRNCVSVLHLAIDRYDRMGRSRVSIEAVDDLEAWLSGILSYQYDCFSALGYVNSSAEVQSVMIQVNNGMYLISIALSMVDAWESSGDDVSSWKPPPSKRQQDQARLRGRSRTRIEDIFSSIRTEAKQEKFSTTVGKNGQFKTIQDAIDSAPSNSEERFSIYVEEGVYFERVYVPSSKTMILLVGTGAGKTIITGNNFVREGVTTMDTATMLVVGDGFAARDLTIRNTAGPELHQAVALRINADKAVFQSCALEGYQDTLYSHTNRHFFDNCTIAGTVDFIFGMAATFFRNCKLVVRPGRTGIYTSMVTAHGRIDPGQTTGLVFQKCSIETSDEFSDAAMKKLKVFLGRPWKAFSRAIFVECYLGSGVDPQGWMPWKGDFALETLLFAEYESYGPGADAKSRVSWSTQLSSSQVAAYSLQNFIQGDAWIS